MENIQKHIEHWSAGANEAIETAEILISKRKILFGLFFYHLSIEKILKALFIKSKKDFPPKTHKLLFLIHNTTVEVDSEMKALFSELMRFQLEGRYPEIVIQTSSYEESVKILDRTNGALKWLQQKLQKLQK